LAWRRVKLDYQGRCFVAHPRLISWIDSDLSAWLNKLAEELLQGYKPHDCFICRSPKSGWMVRPGAVLDVSDEIIFNAIVGNFLPQILEAISWSQGDPDVAYQIKAKADDPKWLSSGFFVWREFDQKSLDRLEEGTQAVAFADIAAFYENID